MQRYPAGSRVKGSVTSITDFGVFIDIGEGIEGLIHQSQLEIERGAHTQDVYKVGDVLEAEVTNIDAKERRISLSMMAIKEREKRREHYEEGGVSVRLGPLMDKLRGGE